MIDTKYFGIIAVAFITLGVTGVGDEIACTAQVTNRKFEVKFTPETFKVAIKTDNGHEYGGIANRYFSPRYNVAYYYLATGFGTGLEIQTEMDGLKRIAICLRDIECYLCKKND